MATKPKRHSMAEALKRRHDVRAFLDEGRPQPENRATPKSSKPATKRKEPRIAVTVRLPESLAHALIDASADRRKNRQKAWSQQDIVAEALEAWLARSG